MNKYILSLLMLPLMSMPLIAADEESEEGGDVSHEEMGNEDAGDVDEGMSSSEDEGAGDSEHGGSEEGDDADAPPPPSAAQWAKRGVSAGALGASKMLLGRQRVEGAQARMSNYKNALKDKYARGGVASLAGHFGGKAMRGSSALNARLGAKIAAHREAVGKSPYNMRSKKFSKNMSMSNHKLGRKKVQTKTNQRKGYTSTSKRKSMKRAAR